MESPRGDLHSGDVINKMKFRPLPPPPRPPRESRKKDRKDPRDEFDDKHDRDDGAEKIGYDLHLNGDYDVEKHTEKCIEVEVSTQTDPLPDDFCCEEFEITDDMKVIEPRVGRTLQDILGDEPDQQEDDSLSKSIQRFREAGQRSFSERSRGSTADRSRASLGSRPTTPNAIVFEKRVPTPIPGSHGGETMLEASITVLPIDDLDYDEEEQDKVDEPKEAEHQIEEPVQEEEPRLITDHLLVECESVHGMTDDQKEESLAKEEISLREEELAKEESPPKAPPRKRPSITVESSPPAEEPEQTKEIAVLPTTLDVAPQPEMQVERPPPLPSKLSIADLEVERLSVHELQAGNITVSQLQSSLVKTDELECKSSNVPPSLELPPGLIDEIIRRVRSSESESHTVETQTIDKPPESPTTPAAPTTPESPLPPRPPLPQQQPEDSHQPPSFQTEYMQYSVPPPSFYTLRDPSEGELHHSSAHRRRRHHRRRDSSSDEESHKEHRRSRHSTRSPEPTIAQLGGQLLHACGNSLMHSMNQIVNILRANEKEGNDRNLSTAIILVIFVTIGFLLLGISGNKNIHHHHWDYFNPPDNKGR